MISANQTILFQGDSITDAGRNFEYKAVNTIEGFGLGYAGLIAAELLASRPADNLKFLNRGISGHRVTDLLARWRVDAINLKPDVLSILIGVNDTWHKFAYNNGCDLELYEKAYRLLLETTRKELPNTRLILCEAFAFPRGPVTHEWIAELKLRSAIVQKLAKETNAVFVPFQQLFDSLLEQAPMEYWLPDGVHPSPAGHFLMAEFWKKHVLTP
ncbi:MAG: SGNH/GDSL hydrolase family protein [Chthoniobacterales bacterium]